MHNWKVALNLGGGASRGYAHIGVLRALHENAIPFDGINGISVGAIIGGLYAMVPDPKYVREQALAILDSEAFRDSVVGTWSKNMNSKASTLLTRLNKVFARTNILGRIFLSRGIMRDGEWKKILTPFFPEMEMQKTKIPFIALATDLQLGKTKIFSSGPILSAVMASSALPLVIPPVEIDGKLYADGGVCDKVGIESGKLLGHRSIIAVDVSNEGLEHQKMANALDIVLRSSDIAAEQVRPRQLARADVVLRPIHTQIHWADYSHAEELIDLGFETTLNSIELIRHKLKLTHPFKRWFSNFFR